MHVVYNRGILRAPHLSDMACDTYHMPMQGQGEATIHVPIAALQGCEAGMDVAQGGRKGQDMGGIVSREGLC
jgi:hypothetical protein